MPCRLKMQNCRLTGYILYVPMFWAPARTAAASDQESYGQAPRSRGLLRCGILTCPNPAPRFLPGSRNWGSNFTASAAYPIDWVPFLDLWPRGHSLADFPGRCNHWFVGWALHWSHLALPAALAAIHLASFCSGDFRWEAALSLGAVSTWAAVKTSWTVRTADFEKNFGKCEKIFAGLLWGLTGRETRSVSFQDPFLNLRPTGVPSRLSVRSVRLRQQEVQPLQQQLRRQQPQERQHTVGNSADK